MIHYIKIRKEFADAVLNGTKNFEVRKNDRNYSVGDRVKFKVIDDDFHELNYKCVFFDITYVLPGGDFGIDPEYCVLGIRPVYGSVSIDRRDLERYQAIEKRFFHLMESPYIRQFDEWDPFKNDYKRNIADAKESGKISYKEFLLEFDPDGSVRKRFGEYDLRAMYRAYLCADATD